MCRRTGTALGALLMVLSSLCAPWAALAGAAQAPAAGPAATAAAPGTGPVPLSGNDVGAKSFGGVASVPVAVPDGMSPVSLSASLELVAPAGLGNVLVRVGGVVRSVLPAALLRPGTQPFSVDLAGAEVRDGVVLVEVENLLRAPGSEVTCGPLASPDLVLSGLTSQLSGTPTAPSSVAGFFAAGVDRFVVEMPEQADEYSAQAVLTLVAGLSARGGAEVGVATAGGAVRGPFVRVVAVTPRPGDLGSVRVRDDGTLEVSGSKEALVAAALAAVPPDSALATTTSATRAEVGNKTRLVGSEVLLEELAGGPVQLSGTGTMSRDIAVSQSALGGPVSSIDLDMAVVHTPMLDRQAGSLSVLWNGILVRSVDLGRSVGRVEFQIPLQGAAVRRDNVMTLRAEVTAPGGGCEGDSVPSTFQLDPESSVTGTSGDSLPVGFRRWPQVAADGLEVAFADATASSVATAELAAAAQVVADLSSLAAEAPAVTVRTGSPGSSAAPLVVGRGETLNKDLDLPLPYGAVRATRIDGRDVSYKVDEPYASLQALAQGGRQVLAFGYSGGNAGLLWGLDSALAAREGSFASLEGSVYLVGEDGEEALVALSTPRQIREAERLEAPKRINASLALVLSVLGAVVVFVAYRYLKNRSRLAAEAREERAATRAKATEAWGGEVVVEDADAGPDGDTVEGAADDGPAED